jgi:hypothetical protein
MLNLGTVAKTLYTHSSLPYAGGTIEVGHPYIRVTSIVNARPFGDKE